PLNYVAYTSPDGGRAGYATYRLKSEWPEHIPTYRLTDSEMVSRTPRTSSPPWRDLLTVDLVGVVEADDQPQDAVLPWLLADYRRLKRRPSDGLYLRILDPEAALAART